MPQIILINATKVILIKMVLHCISEGISINEMQEQFSRVYLKPDVKHYVTTIYNQLILDQMR